MAAALLAGACSEGPADPIAPIPETIVVSGAPASFVSLGDTVRLNATVRNSDGGIITTLAVAWDSSDPSVATVTEEGVVTSTGNGSATIVASVEGAEGSTDVLVQQVPAGLRFAPDPVRLLTTGDTATLQALLVDANDNGIEAIDASWGSDDPTVVLIDPASGRATAVAEGQVVITATADGFSGEMAALVGDDAVVISSVDPSPLVGGSETVVRGFGFAPRPADNEVTLDGEPVTVRAASSVELQLSLPLSDCEPARISDLRVAARGLSDAESAEVLPEGPIVALAVGEGTFTSSGCLNLSEGEGSDRYLVGVLSTAEAPSSLTGARLLASAGTFAPTAEGRTAERTASSNSDVGPGTFRVAVDASTSREALTRTPPLANPDLLVPTEDFRSGEQRVRAAERSWLESLGPLTPRTPSPRSGAALTGPAGAVPTLGDTLDLTVPNNSCSNGTPVRAVVRLVGDAAIFLEDTENPAGGFTQAEYAELDRELATTTLPVLNANFGSFADVDDNGDRVLVLVTKEINRQPNLAGFVFGGDLVGLLEGANCPVSNNAEIFYGIAPDPNGEFGTERTKEDVATRYPPLIAHELTHVIQFTTFFTEGIPVKSTWELEGGATLAEQLVGYEILGHGPRQDLGFEEWQLGNNPDWYRDWVIDMALYFGLQADGQNNLFKVIGAPHRCSWTGFASQGNTGPCDVTRAPYGVPSTLLRWIMDHYGEAFPGGDSALMRQMTRSPTVGLRTLEEATGLESAELLSRFAATLWADGRVGNELLSWNIRAVFDQLVPEARLQPATSETAEPTQTVLVRATSSSYLEWTPPSTHPPTSLRIRDSIDGSPLPDHMVLWVLRVQ